MFVDQTATSEGWALMIFYISPQQMSYPQVILIQTDLKTLGFLCWGGSNLSGLCNLGEKAFPYIGVPLGAVAIIFWWGWWLYCWLRKICKIWHFFGSLHRASTCIFNKSADPHFGGYFRHLCWYLMALLLPSSFSRNQYSIQQGSFCQLIKRP